jgi:hypothetical protein
MFTIGRSLTVSATLDAEDARPALIAIEHDDYHAEYVGHLADGRQFFLTTPFIPGHGSHPGEEFVALYLFHQDGQLADSKIDSFGPRETMDHTARRDLRDRRLRELGPVTFDRIEIAPFTIERFGVAFGLIVREPEESDDPWAVTVEPGDYMAFFAPWDSGVYDT